MYKNQLQELAQRSCFNLPSYTCIREGPDHAPRFKSTVNFNGEIFESPAFCTTLRQAEHSAAEVALSTLANRGPSRSLAARVLDETGAYKNLLQETVHRAGLNLPVYTTVRSGPGHVPVFTCHVELAGMSFTGEPAKTKKQAQKNAAMAAWSALKQMGSSSSSTSSSSCPSSEPEGSEDQVIVARALARICPPDANRSSIQNNRHRGQQRTIPISRNMNPISCGISMYPMPYPGLPYSNFSSEVTMYQMWQQDQASQQQARLLTLPVAQVPQPGPHIIPFIHSIIQPDNMQYFPASVQESIGMVPGFTVSASRPPVCFSNHSMPFQISRSQVTIKEIQDERAQEKEKWVYEDADPDGRKVNIQSSPSMFSQSEAQNSPISGLSRAEQSIQRQTQDATFGSRFINPNPICVGNPHGLDSSRATYRPHLLPTQSSLDTVKYFRPPLIAAPVMVRTVGLISPVSPKPENMSVCMPAPVTTRTAIPCSSRTGPMSTGRAPFMAPAVQIRSVVPVCSAPPTRKVPNLVQDGVLTDGEKKTKEMKDVMTELGKLQI